MPKESWILLGGVFLAVLAGNYVSKKWIDPNMKSI